MLAAGVAELATKHYDDRAQPKALEKRGHDEPYWIALMDEEIPREVARAVSVGIGDEESYWPSLRALLERCTRWFRGTEGPLEISSYLEKHLATKVTPAFLEKFLPELTSKDKVVAFHEALLALLAGIDGKLAPLDPVRTLGGEMRAKNPIDILIARYRTIPYVGRRADIEQLWEWLNADAPVSLQVVTGRGGSGKTRFAYEFLEEIGRRAPGIWHAGFVERHRFEG